MLRLALAAAALVTAAPLAAEDWRVVAIFGEFPRLQAGMIDADGIDLTNPGMPVVRTGVLRQIPIESDVFLIVSFQEIDCAANTYRITQVQGFDAEGDLVIQDGTSDEHKPITDGTTLNIYRRAACENDWWGGMKSTEGKPLSELAAELFVP